MSELKFNDDGLLEPTSLRQAIDSFLATDNAGKIPGTQRSHDMAVAYLNGLTIEEIAKSYNVTRERIRQILAKFQRHIGVKQAAVPLNQWVDARKFTEFENKIREQLSFYLDAYEEDVLATNLMQLFREEVEILEKENE